MGLPTSNNVDTSQHFTRLPIHPYARTLLIFCGILSVTPLLLHLVTSQDVEPVDLSKILSHLRILDRIVDYHNGTRAAGTSGYDASALYITTLLQRAQACDVIEKQYFTAPQYRQLGASFASVGCDEPIALQEGHDFALIYGPSASFDNVSSVWLADHGCPFVVGNHSVPVSGKVVVIDRPSLAFLDGKTSRACTINDLALSVHARGALAVLIANNANDTLLWPLQGHLDVAWDGDKEILPQIPIVTVSYVTGQ